jgi:TonB-dependent receptor
VVTGGNPLLNPFRADTYDLGLEWYFAEESLLGIGLFYKDIDTFVQTSRETRPFNTSGLPDSLLDGTGALPTDDFQFNIPINTPGGPLQGVELSYQQPFSGLPGFWSNFGVQANYTYVDSEIQYLTSTGQNSLRTDLTGLSKNAYNATLYYEGERFGARVSAARRSDYLTVVPGRNNNDVEGTKGTTTIDASASWKFNEQLEFSIEGLNLTDEYNDQWVDSVGDRASVYHHTGRQYFVGVRYRF